MVWLMEVMTGRLIDWFMDGSGNLYVVGFI